MEDFELGLAYGPRRYPPGCILTFCPGCRATALFIYNDELGVFECLGDAETLRPGCGKQLKPKKADDLNSNDLI